MTPNEVGAGVPNHQDNRPTTPNLGKTRKTIVASSGRRALPQELHCDLGIVDLGGEVGS